MTKYTRNDQMREMTKYKLPVEFAFVHLVHNKSKSN